MSPLTTLLIAGASILGASVPMVALLVVIWWLDRYHREPPHMVALAFAWGAVGAVLIALSANHLLGGAVSYGLTALGSALQADLRWMSDAALATVVAPMVEEPAKAVFFLLLLNNRHFDNMTDGFVYGAAAGLGFGMTENFVYFLSATTTPESWVQTLVIRTLFTAPMHATATAFVGAGLGYARFRGGGPQLLYGSLGMLAAVALHMTWNGLLTLGEVLHTEAAMALDFAVLAVIFVLVFVAFEGCLWVESRQIRAQLQDEEARGLLPEGHAQRIASWSGRRKTTWLAAGIDRAAYVSAATDLAVHKVQLDQLGSRATQHDKDEVHRLRAKVAGLLSRGVAA